MSDFSGVSDEFRSWVRAGIDRRAKWLLIFSDTVDFVHFCDFCEDDEALDLEIAADEAHGEEVRLVGVYDLRGTEEEILDRVRRKWAVA
ncbi:MAG: hypothetical protein ACK4Y9_07210 [Hyphomonas sp.]